MLAQIYGKTYSNSSAVSNIHAITFVGTVLGQLVFGYTSDKWSRKNSLLISTVILIVFAALGAGSYGYKGNVQGMFAALTAYRFLVGIGTSGCSHSFSTFARSRALQTWSQACQDPKLQKHVFGALLLNGEHIFLS